MLNTGSMINRHAPRLAAFLTVSALVFGSSAAVAQHDHAKGHSHDHSHAHEAKSAVSTIKIEIVPDENHVAGKTAETIVRLTGPGGKPVSLDDLDVAHTEKIHLLIVNEALTDYHHEHPVGSDKPGEYRFKFKPRFGGPYYVWADLLPLATKVQEYSKTEVKVKGTPDKPRNNTNTSAEVDGYKFTWTVEGNKPLRTGASAEVKVRVTGPDGQPFKQLEPVMGAYAHMVAFPTNLESVTHVHPSGPEPTTNSERGGPDLSFHVVPEQAGFHKFYLQTQIGGRDKFVAFGVDVAAGSPTTADANAIYTCPMHPEVRQKGPGKCPKCGGMALVPEKKDGEKVNDHSHGH